MKRYWLSIFLGGLVLAGCSPGKKAENAPEPQAAKKEKPPEKFHVKFDTTKGAFILEINRDWAPRGADRFYELVQERFFDGSRFFRVRPKFAVQFGIHKDPKMMELWRELKLPDDPVRQSNKREFVTFAMRGPSSRTTQVFINLGNNVSLDQKSFAPFGRVVEGMDVIDKLYAGYGEVQSLGGSGPDPSKIELMGEEYLERSFPRLDKINSASVVTYTPGAREAA